MADRAKDYGDFERVYRHPDGALRRGTVYILHFEWEVPEEWWREDVQHYIGGTGVLDNRTLKHVILESGSAITMSRVYYGRPFVLGAAFPGTVEDEERLETEWGGSKRCELCQLWRSGKRGKALREAESRLADLLPYVNQARGLTAHDVRSTWFNEFGLRPEWFAPI